ncbi:Helicase associated domain-containing protein [Teratosphaeria destructans]|uniref:Helicase associated domain-containing protein n=1 Tax=Teratosphaeria destructans TaxID=418781 RepID=A0A9W7SK88_9PEZI|nr:Helicase associated domain-containing protein [Teratosphaeria destructans]
MALAIANPMPQSVTSALSPQQTSCSSSTSGTFQIQTVDAANPQTQRDITARQLAPGALTLTLADGVLKDQAGRTGYIAANEQLQFDNPIPAGAPTATT